MSNRSEVEEEAYLILSMLPEAEINGFGSLFYQLYTLQQCATVENGLRKLGLVQIAALFSEAKLIYLRGRTSVTEEEYRELDPFNLDIEQARRFDQISDQIRSGDSGLYYIDDRLCQYFKSNLAALLGNDT